MSPEEILTKKALSEPHRTYTGPVDHEVEQIQALRQVLKETVMKELLEAKTPA